ncbi:PA0069 family radical SAM protein [Halomonas denitrificans]|nr:PA0069 family radical SAM protein [Halomonas denitrificans]
MSAQAPIPRPPLARGRGSTGNPDHRFTRTSSEIADDGWPREIDDLPPVQTTVTEETARSIISRNQSPDVPFEQSINPYRGCEHGCVYCFARPSHSYLYLSPGLDFETKLFFKRNALELLEAELRRPNYQPKPIVLGINTDAYQPIERKLGITRQLLELLLEYRHPVSILTKGITILRDLDVLGELADRNLLSVSVSLTTLDNELKRTLEPRTASPAGRLKVLRAMAELGLKPGVLIAPVIPQINDREIEAMLEAAADAGAGSAGYVLLRLPHELKTVFRDWLTQHYPDRAKHVMSLVRQMRGGKDYDSAFGTRMSGTGPFATLIRNRFRRAQRRLGLTGDDRVELDATRFRCPTRSGDQLSLL